jgi:uncharacterized membrane protein YebE (DUF533 family)
MFNPEKLLGGLIHGGLRRKSSLASLFTNGALAGLVGSAIESVQHYLNRGGDVAPSAVEVPTGPSSLPQQADAVLLIRAMIAAAYADGAIDARERAVIFDKLKELDLSEDEREFISSELLAPKNCKSLVTAVHSPEMARQVYLVSLLAVQMDSDAERGYMQNLARELALDAADVSRMHQEMNLPFQG